jgi:LacI family transcriptional regulator, repressor for deo operon, udp, cdd, tsx, nupC, and nupG
MSARRPQSSVTIADVARLSGVSAATVSRTLANPEIVTEATRGRVMQAVRDTGYTPNAAARNLRQRKAMMALVVVPDIANPFFAEVLRGIDAAISAAGYGLIIGNLGNDSEKEAAFVELSRSGQVDGVLLLCGHILKGRGASLEDAGVPIVAACEAIPGAAFPQVEIDNCGAAQAAVAHLVGLGHRRIAYLSGPAGNILDAERCRGYRAALVAAGFELNPRYEISGDFTFQTGAEAARVVLAMPAAERPTALFAANDEMAIGFLKAAQAADLAIPRDFSVVGFDAIEYAEYCIPTLTTVSQPRREIGAVAGRLLVKLMSGGGGLEASVVLKAPLLRRDSAGPAPAVR